MKKVLVCYIIIGFILNFIWEISQAGLYAPHFQGLVGFVAVHIEAALRDVLILLVIYLIAVLIYWDWEWIMKNKKSGYTTVCVLGVIFAVGIEKYALETGRWAYNDLMPIIPYLKVGVTPVLQLAILVPFSVFLAKRIVFHLIKKS